MLLVEPNYEVIYPVDINPKTFLQTIEEAARTCYKSENKIGTLQSCPMCKRTADDEVCSYCEGTTKLVSWEALTLKLLARKHHAMLEFAPDITVKFTVDRGVSHEIVRHRLCSFAQESTRYCTYEKDIVFIVPEWYDDKDEASQVWKEACRTSEIAYHNLLTFGWSPQQARGVLPNALKTEINVKANLREWREIFKQRTSIAAHPQMREIMIPLLREFQENVPFIFDDIKVKKLKK